MQYESIRTKTVSFDLPEDSIIEVYTAYLGENRTYMFAASAYSSVVPQERRASRRYTITTIAQLRLAGSTKRVGAVIHDISNRGVFFRAEINLLEGARVELSVDWPVHLDDRIPLSLVLLGTVCRSDSTGTAIRIKRHEWRIRARKKGPTIEIGT